jgi:hypothetical protein
MLLTWNTFNPLGLFTELKHEDISFCHTVQGGCGRWVLPTWRPLRISRASRELGSATSTGWNRRSRAASFSKCWRYSLSVVAPTACSRPLARAGFRRLPKSRPPPAAPLVFPTAPAPTIVWISSILHQSGKFQPPPVRQDGGKHWVCAENSRTYHLLLWFRSENWLICNPAAKEGGRL